MNGTLIGALICTVFGGIWAVAGTTGLPGRARVVALPLSGVAMLLIAAYVWFRPEARVQVGVFHGLVYSISVAAEAAAIAIAVVFLKLGRRSDLILPAVGLIVGLHFIGMWKATTLALFLVVAAAMSAVSLVAFLLPQDDGQGFSARRSVPGFGCAAVLWAAACAIR